MAEPKPGMRRDEGPYRTGPHEYVGRVTEDGSFVLELVEYDSNGLTNHEPATTRDVVDSIQELYDLLDWRSKMLERYPPPLRVKRA